jgi:hypothetical protein
MDLPLHLIQESQHQDVNVIEAQTRLQALIDCRDIDSARVLINFIAAKGYTLIHNAPSYMRVQTPDGGRFRVRFGFKNDAIDRHEASANNEFDARKAAYKGKRELKRTQAKLHEKGFWIYALTAETLFQKAVYFGVTRNYIHSIGAAWRDNNPGKPSGLLFDWATQHDTKIQAALLCFCDEARGVAEAYLAHWHGLARAAGYECLNRASQLKTLAPTWSHNQPQEWPEGAVRFSSIDAHSYATLPSDIGFEQLRTHPFIPKPAAPDALRIVARLGRAGIEPNRLEKPTVKPSKRPSSGDRLVFFMGLNL